MIFVAIMNFTKKRGASFLQENASTKRLDDRIAATGLKEECSGYVIFAAVLTWLTQIIGTLLILP